MKILIGAFLLFEGQKRNTFALMDTPIIEKKNIVNYATRT